MYMRMEPLYREPADLPIFQENLEKYVIIIHKDTPRN